MIIYILYKKPAFFNQLIPVYNCPSVKAGIMMTKNLLMGNIRGQLVQLAFPLLLGNVLQQLYNAVDSIIIGRFVGSTAFAAVGVAGTVMNLFVFMISGVCVGVSILFAQLYRRAGSGRLPAGGFSGTKPWQRVHTGADYP